MKDVLAALKGSRLLGQLVTAEGVVRHFLLRSGKVLEVVSPLREN